MTTRSAACSLASEEQPSYPLGLETPLPGPSPPPLHTTAPGTSCRLCSAAPTGAGFGSVPVPSSPTHLPPPDKANFPFSRSPPGLLRTSLRALALWALCFAGLFCPAVHGFPAEGPGSIPRP